MNEIPAKVIEALAFVRETGLTNMFDRPTVIEIVEFTGDQKAAAWLRENRHRYGEALMAMGRARKDGHEQFSVEQ